jgi:hypothetical protein
MTFAIVRTLSITSLRTSCQSQSLCAIDRSKCCCCCPVLSRRAYRHSMMWMGQTGSLQCRFQSGSGLYCGYSYRYARRSRCYRYSAKTTMIALCLLFAPTTLPTASSSHSASSSFDRSYPQRSLVAFHMMPVNGGIRKADTNHRAQQSRHLPVAILPVAVASPTCNTWRRHRNHSMRQCHSRLFSAASSPVPTDSSTGSCSSKSESAPNASSSATSESARIVWDDEITSGLQRAKQVLEKSKAKLAARQEQSQSAATTLPSSDTAATASNNNDNVPFFAQLRPVEVSVASFSSSSTLTPTAAAATVVASTSNHARESLVKTLNAATGLITIDGEKLAARSEQEEWEFRSLAQVFSQENSDGSAAISVDQPARKMAASSSARSEPLADRDVLASIYNLRLQLQKEDYHRIFDAKNRFIGEDN